MFGFVWRQPIDVTLRRMRLLHVGLIVSSQIILWRIVDKLDALESEYAGTVYIAIATALIGQIWAAVGVLHKPIEQDDVMSNKTKER